MAILLLAYLAVAATSWIPLRALGRRVEDLRAAADAMARGDLGAEIIKIEDPKSGDPFRGWGAADYSATFGSVNRNKKSVILDLKSDDGRQAACALAARADVIIENFRPGTMDRLGLGYERLSESNAGLIYCSITGFGTSARAGVNASAGAASAAASSARAAPRLTRRAPSGCSPSGRRRGRCGIRCTSRRRSPRSARSWNPSSAP